MKLFKVISLSYSLLCAFITFNHTCNAQTSDVVNPPKLENIDILGMHIGDSVDAIIAIMQQQVGPETPEQEERRQRDLEFRNYTCKNPIDGTPYTCAAGTGFFKSKDNGNTESLKAMFTSPLTGNKACAVGRFISEDLKQGKKTLLTKSFIDGAIQKYGQPAVIDKTGGIGINMKWLFDQNGKLIQNKAAYAPYQYDAIILPLTQVDMNRKGTYLSVNIMSINGDYFDSATITLISYDYLISSLKIDQKAAQEAKANKEKQEKEEAEKKKVNF